MTGSQGIKKVSKNGESKILYLSWGKKNRPTSKIKLKTKQFYTIIL